MRILVRTSTWTVWARRFGSIALPLMVLPVLMHRGRLIETPEFLLIETVAGAAAILALVLSIGGMARIWVTGDRGWGRALGGLFFGALSLTPLTYVVIETMRLPAVTDVSTTNFAPPGLGFYTPVVSATPAVLPGLGPRSYPVDAPQIFGLVEAAVEAEGWEVAADVKPGDAVGTGQLNAVATTLLGFRDEVAIRVSGDGANTVVDMRSASLGRSHDLGDNARRIAAFLVGLDERVTLYQRDAAAAVTPHAPDIPAETAPMPAPPPVDAETPADEAPADEAPPD